MTLEEAIRIIEEDTRHPTARFMPELLEAEKLGIEALKRIEDTRKILFGGVSVPRADMMGFVSLLPSETPKQR